MPSFAETPIHVTNLPENAPVLKLLQKLLHNVPQVLLFEGPKNKKKGECARAFAKLILQTKQEHPIDLREIFPEETSNMHSIHAIRTFIKESSMPPFEAKYKIFLIHDADHMLPTSMNALLKTLEEPLPTTIIILITSHYQDLPLTITSRCFTLSFTSQENTNLSEICPQQPIAALTFNLGIHLLNRKYPIQREYENFQNEEEVLLYLSFFYRDLHLLKIGGDPCYLFYKDREQVLKDHLSSPILPWEEVQKKIDQIYQATLLHIPLSHSLYLLL